MNSPLQEMMSVLRLKTKLRDELGISLNVFPTIDEKRGVIHLNGQLGENSFAMFVSLEQKDNHPAWIIACFTKQEKEIIGCFSDWMNCKPFCSFKDNNIHQEHICLAWSIDKENETFEALKKSGEGRDFERL